VIGGIPFTQGPIAHILKNRTYIGELNHGKLSIESKLPVFTRAAIVIQKELAT
jgi:hypothetical protein